MAVQQYSWPLSVRTCSIIKHIHRCFRELQTIELPEGKGAIGIHYRLEIDPYDPSIVPTTNVFWDSRYPDRDSSHAVPKAWNGLFKKTNLFFRQLKLRTRLLLLHAKQALYLVSICSLIQRLRIMLVLTGIPSNRMKGKIYIDRSRNLLLQTVWIPRI